jgi:hypothetical protein
MSGIKTYTDLSQSKKLAEILPLESADMYYSCGAVAPDVMIGSKRDYRCYTVCWSLAALYDALPEIDNISPTLEKVKADDGYEGYYYFIEYKNKIMIPYSKNPVDACYRMVMKLHELNLL